MQINLFSRFLIILLVSFFLHSCSEFKKSMGFEKDIPDEFLVRKVDPLSKPPNYDLLPPDTKNKKVKKNGNKSLKDIISENVKADSSSSPLTQNANTSNNSQIENIILDQIKK